MQEKHIFEYAVIRLVPRVEREEFLNIGVILYCRDLLFLDTRIHIDQVRIESFYAGLDLECIQQNLLSYGRIAAGHPQGGPIAKLDPASRFRWLTATRSTILQSSKVHPGLCTDPGKSLQSLFDALVSIGN